MKQKYEEKAKCWKKSSKEAEVKFDCTGEVIGVRHVKN